VLLDRHPGAGRLVIILISESRDHGSHVAKLENVVQQLSVSNTLVYSLSFSPARAEFIRDLKGENPSSQIDLMKPLVMAANGLRKNAADAVAELTGGEYATFGSKSTFDTRMDALSGDDHNRYLLGACTGRLRGRRTAVQLLELRPTFAHSDNTLIRRGIPTMNPRWALSALLFVSSVGALSAQSSPIWHDPSPHKIQFVTVEEGVKLEVLDWGGSGRALVLLAGLGNTAHVFDDFAPKLTNQHHVYGITRRGFGASSAPPAGSSADRLGDDVLAVLDALNIERPVLVGHSIAGEELSSIGSRRPERVAGLIYLDAGYSYAYYAASVGNLIIDLRELEEKLQQLHPAEGLPDPQLAHDLLLQYMPQVETDLRFDLQLVPDPKRPSPTPNDLASFSAFCLWVKRTRGIDMPEAEIRQAFQARPDGGVGELRSQSNVSSLIQAGEQKYTDIRVPVLAIFADPEDDGPYMNNDPTARAAVEASDMAVAEAQAKAFENGISTARVVRLAHANHHMFISNEADVLREMRTFLAGLK
jgi:pimeloyl-ACP methyl ester carboxylesterase